MNRLSAGMLKPCLLFCCAFLATASINCAPTAPRVVSEPGQPFVAFEPAPDFQPPQIVLQYDPATKTGANWEEVKDRSGTEVPWYDEWSPLMDGRAANYLREGLGRMTGKEFPVVSKNDLSKGIVLVLLKNAPDEIRNDPAVKEALKADPEDSCAANEAFFIRSETNRLLIVANRSSGLLDAVVELLESADYEVLGMGPNWTYVPDCSNKTLVFNLQRAGRPGYYLRRLFLPGTYFDASNLFGVPLSDPADEPLSRSWERWVIGTRLAGHSMASSSGHSFQGYDKPVIEHIKKNKLKEGFLVEDILVGPFREKPSTVEKGKVVLWIADDPKGTEGYQKAIVYNGNWGPVQEFSFSEVNATLDITVPWVRQIVLEQLKARSENHFAKNPDLLFVFTNEPEDGAAYDKLGRLARNPNWYLDYLKSKGVEFGKPYVLNGFMGLNQPNEIWDPASPSDHVFGFDNWLLREYDAWIDSLPAAQQVTSTGRSKKDFVRIAGYSYYQHDVPPDFNLDPRIQIQLASFSVHRGSGKWAALQGRPEMARAFKKMLPHSPVGDYWIAGTYWFYPDALNGVRPYWDQSASAIWKNLHDYYEAGIRGIYCEQEHAWGRNGLGHYLQAKMLWNPRMTEAELESLRNRWFQRAFGSAWKEMKAYYDFMLPNNYPCNTPRNWGRAIRLIDAADKKLDGKKEPAARRRIDDVKTFWYFYYLLDSGQGTAQSPAMKEFAWKGQSANMVCLRLAIKNIFKVEDARTAAGPEYSAGPAHYTHAETQAWWAKVLDFWKVTPVVSFSESTLADGKPAKSADLNDLVMVKEFQDGSPDTPFAYNSANAEPVPFLMVARRKDELIGFKLAWPFYPNDNYYIAKKLPYGVDIWNPAGKQWEPWVDKTMVVQQSEEMTGADGTKLQVVDVRLKAPRPGTYRFDIGYGGNVARLAGPAYDPVTSTYTGPAVGFTYFTQASGHTQSPVYFYIPKGTKSLDLEVWDPHKRKYLQLYKGLPAQKPALSRRIDIGVMGTHTIALQAGEDGTVARFEGNGFAFPYLYSIPTLWAKSPSALLVPRDIAQADGLTIMK